MNHRSIKPIRRVLACAVTLGLLVTACGGGSEDGGGGGGAASGPSEPPYGTIDYLGWEGYDTFFGSNEQVISDLGIEFNSAYIGATPDIAAKFASGGGDGIDLIAWTGASYKQIFATKGATTPITEEEVPNLALLDQIFKDDKWGQFKDADGNWIAIPFSFAPLGITYDSTKIEPKSYTDLLDPKYKGLIGIPDVPPLHLQLSSSALGYDADTVTPEQLDEMIAFMEPYFAQSKSLSPSFGDIIGQLSSGEIVASFGAFPGLAAFTDNPDIKSVFPTERTTGFVELYSIPADADNRNGALAFINAMLDPANNAAANEALHQATPINDAVPMMSDENKSLYPYDDLDAFFADNPIVGLPDGENGSITMGDFIDAYSNLAVGG